MMKLHSGKIASSNRNGELYMKLAGEVRVTLCTTLSRCIDDLLTVKKVDSFVVDLLAVKLIDSTTMGLLARLAIDCERRYRFRPVLWCRRDYVRNLVSMSLDEIFDIETFAPGVPAPFDRAPGDGVRDHPALGLSEHEAGKTVLEAHLLLMALNPEKESSFFQLLSALEQSGGGSGDHIS